ncbi:hypothetical protein LXA43DRAFT_1101055 [Ganoderma leucocontextum]|nr:hypothetical protein LXA43DRAFT_1101055 [Ganoderma leucocontextum]
MACLASCGKPPLDDDTLSALYDRFMHVVELFPADNPPDEYLETMVRFLCTNRAQPPRPDIESFIRRYVATIGRRKVTAAMDHGVKTQAWLDRTTDDLKNWNWHDHLNGDLGTRSAVVERVQALEQANQDAEDAIDCATDWPDRFLDNLRERNPDLVEIGSVPVYSGVDPDGGDGPELYLDHHVERNPSLVKIGTVDVDTTGDPYGGGSETDRQQPWLQVDGVPSEGFECQAGYVACPVPGIGTGIVGPCESHSTSRGHPKASALCAASSRYVEVDHDVQADGSSMAVGDEDMLPSSPKSCGAQQRTDRDAWVQPPDMSAGRDDIAANRSSAKSTTAREDVATMESAGHHDDEGRRTHITQTYRRQGLRSPQTVPQTVAGSVDVVPKFTGSSALEEDAVEPGRVEDLTLKALPIPYFSPSPPGSDFFRVNSSSPGFALGDIVEGGTDGVVLPANNNTLLGPEDGAMTTTFDPPTSSASVLRKQTPDDVAGSAWLGGPLPIPSTLLAPATTGVGSDARRTAITRAVRVRAIRNEHALAQERLRLLEERRGVLERKLKDVEGAPIAGMPSQ